MLEECSLSCSMARRMVNTVVLVLWKYSIICHEGHVFRWHDNIWQCSLGDKHPSLCRVVIALRMHRMSQLNTLPPGGLDQLCERCRHNKANFSSYTHCLNSRVLRGPARKKAPWVRRRQGTPFAEIFTAFYCNSHYWRRVKYELHAYNCCIMNKMRIWSGNFWHVNKRDHFWDLKMTQLEVIFRNQRTLILPQTYHSLLYLTCFRTGSDIIAEICVWFTRTGETWLLKVMTPRVNWYGWSCSWYNKGISTRFSV